MGRHRALDQATIDPRDVAGPAARAGTGIVGYATLVVAYFQLPDDWQAGFITFLGLLGVGLLAATVLRRD